MPGACAAKPASGAWSWRARRRIQRSQLVFATKPNEARHNQTHSNVEKKRAVYRLASCMRLQAYLYRKMMRVVALVGLWWWWRSGGRRASFQLPPCITTGGLGGGAGSATADSQGRYDGDLKRCSGVTADEQRWGGECGRARRLAEGAFGCCG